MVKRILKGAHKKVKKHLGKIMRLDANPFFIALSFALGTIIAVLPTFGLGLVMGLVLLFFFRRLSKAAMIAAFVLFNPLIQLLLNVLNYNIGLRILAGKSVGEAGVEVYNALALYTQRLLLGSVVMALIFGLVGFFIVYGLADAHQKKSKEQYNNP
jgi:uncharacterized protein